MTVMLVGSDGDTSLDLPDGGVAQHVPNVDPHGCCATLVLEAVGHCLRHDRCCRASSFGTYTATRALFPIVSMT